MSVFVLLLLVQTRIIEVWLKYLEEHWEEHGSSEKLEQTRIYQVEKVEELVQVGEEEAVILSMLGHQLLQDQLYPLANQFGEIQVVEEL